VRARDEFEVAVGSHRLHAERWGSASAPLVLGLPGLTGTSANFAFLGERIGSDSLQLVALDLRGRGRSTTTAPGTYGWENHALDVLAVATELGFERFAVIGQSMGGSVAVQAAALDGARLTAVVLVDVAGRVDRGVGPAIAASIGRLGRVYDSVDHYLREVRTQGLIEPWNEYWERAYRRELCAVDGGVRPRTSTDAVAEDRAYTATQDPYSRWLHLGMPTLLLRATRELRPGAGFVVPADDRDRFLRDVPQAMVAEIDANHLTINTHDETAAAVRTFLATTTTSVR
jgi:pimeloyl-ACP methyl ester carboxylesterase